MRTCLTAVLLALWSVTTVSAQSSTQPSGVVFVGDMQSIDRAVLESASLPLPAVGVQPNQTQQAAASNAVRPVAYQAPAAQRSTLSPSMQPTTQAEPKRKTLFGSFKAPSWMTGKKKSVEPTVDPFNNAALQARQDLGAKLRDPAVQPIPTHASQRSSGSVAPVAYQPRPEQQRSSMPRPMAMQAAKQAKQQQSSRQSGIALRKENGPRVGLLSGLFGSKKSQPTPAAQPTQQKLASRPMPSTMPKKMTSKTMASSNGPAQQPSAKSNTLRSAAPMPAPKPMQRLASRTAPVKPNAYYREPSGVATVVTSPSREPAGSVVMISDADVSTKKSIKAMPTAPAIAKAGKKSAPLPLVVGPTSKPIKPQPKAVAEAKPAPKPAAPESAAPTPLVVTDSQVKSIETAPRLVAPNPTATYARTSPQPKMRKAVKPLPIVEAADAEPSERSRALLAEAHGLAATAATYEDFSAVVQRCRYVLAIDQSMQAQAYANQLGGWALTKRGEQLETEDRLEEANNDFQDALACDPQCWRAVHALGVLAARNGDAEEAGRRFNDTIELNPEYAKAYSNRAALAVQEGNYQAALQDYQQAIEIDPDMAVAHTGRGRVCHMLGLLDQGLQHLDAAAMLDPTDGMIAIGRGDLLTDLGRYGQALQAYQRAIELEPSLTAAHRNLAWMQATCPVEAFRDGESALQHAEIAERLAEGTDDLTLDTKAAALASVGRFDEATALQREAIELAPESDAGVYLERLSLYERGESFTSKPVAVRQATYMK